MTFWRSILRILDWKWEKHRFAMIFIIFEQYVHTIYKINDNINNIEGNIGE